MFGVQGEYTTFGVQGECTIFGVQGECTTFGVQGECTMFGVQGECTMFGVQGEYTTFGLQGEYTMFGVQGEVAGVQGEVEGVQGEVEGVQEEVVGVQGEGVGFQGVLIGTILVVGVACASQTCRPCRRLIEQPPSGVSFGALFIVNSSSMHADHYQHKLQWGIFAVLNTAAAEGGNSGQKWASFKYDLLAHVPSKWQALDFLRVVSSVCGYKIWS